MKISKKTLFTLCALIFTLNTHCMESEEETQRAQRQSQLELTPTSENPIETVGNILLGMRKMNDTDKHVFAQLPKEIIGLIYQYVSSSSPEEVGKAILSISLVNKELNQLINNPTFCLNLIKYLAKKLNCSDLEICRALKTTEAKRRLPLQVDLFKMCQHERPNQTTFETLCSHGVNLDFTYFLENQIVTSLMIAALLGNRRMCSYLLETEVNINQANSNGTTALMYAMSHHSKALNAQDRKTMLTVAGQLMGNNKTTINQQDNDGNTAFIFWIKQAGIFDTNLLQQFLARGADPEIANHQGETALIIAQRRKFQKFVDLMNETIAKKRDKQ